MTLWKDCRSCPLQVCVLRSEVPVNGLLTFVGGKRVGDVRMAYWRNSPPIVF